MFKIFEQISGFLPHQESADIKKHMLMILDGLLDKIGYKEVSSENALTVCLRQEAAKWACILGSFVCKKAATKMLMDKLSDPMQTILPGWQHWTYCRGFMLADKHTWEKMFTLHTETLNNSILEFLACSEDSNIAALYVNVMSGMGNNTDYTDDINPFNVFIVKQVRNNIMLDYFLQRFNLIKPRNITWNIALTNIINHVYSEEQVYKIGKFMLRYSHRLISFAMFERKLEIRLSEIKRQTRYFQGFLMEENKN